jgi:hypothetical protein
VRKKLLAEMETIYGGDPAVIKLGLQGHGLA